MKLILTHPVRDFWLRLKALVAAAHWPCASVKARRVTRPKHQRTIAFLELP